MINLKFSVTNPWWNRFDSLYSTSGSTPFKNKFWEIQTLKSDDILTFDLRVTTRQDHAGIDLWLGFFGYAVNLQFYDNRHWDSEVGDWQAYSK
jgi:hypothetical protein